MYFPVGLHLNPLIFQRGLQLLARKLLQARLQWVYSGTAITQKLPSILKLKICCPHGIHFARDDFTVFFIWTQLSPGLQWWYSTTFLYQGWTTFHQLFRPCQGNEQRSAVTSLRPALSLRTGICGIKVFSLLSRISHSSPGRVTMATKPGLSGWRHCCASQCLFCQ